MVISRSDVAQQSGRHVIVRGRAVGHSAGKAMLRSSVRGGRIHCYLVWRLRSDLSSPSCVRRARSCCESNSSSSCSSTEVAVQNSVLVEVGGRA